jgi:hypothetical protein
MTTKATRVASPRAAMPAVEADERHQPDVDSFITRNREELDTSIRRSRDEVGKGVHATRTIEDMIADGRERHHAG